MNYYAIPGLKFTHDQKIGANTIESSQNIIDRIIYIVCSHYKVTKDELMSKSRIRQFVIARQICISLILKNTSLTLADVGRIFGGRDHTTAIRSRNAIQSLREAYESFNKEFIIISNKI